MAVKVNNIKIYSSIKPYHGLTGKNHTNTTTHTTYR